MKTIFTIALSLLVFVGCGDANRNFKIYIYTGEETSEIVSNPETHPGLTRALEIHLERGTINKNGSRVNKDMWVNGKVRKIGGANDVYLAASVDPEFKSTIWSGNNRWLKIGSGSVSEDGFIDFTLGSMVPSGTTVYFRGCYVATSETQSILWLNKNFSHCDQNHEVLLLMVKKSEAKYWEGEPYEYQKLDTKILPMRKACTTKAIAGIVFCYEWDFNTLTAKNTGAEGVQLKAETAEKKTVFDTTAPLGANTSKTVQVPLSLNEVIDVKVWKDSVFGSIERFKDEIPSATGRFKVTENELVIEGLLESSVHTLALPSAHLVECAIERTVLSNTLDENSDEEYSDKVICKNTSVSHVEISLRELTPNPATTPVGVYITNGLILDNMNVGGEKTETVSLNFPLKFTSVYAIEIKTDGWFDDVNLRSVLPFQVVQYGETFSINQLPVSSYYEPEEN